MGQIRKPQLVKLFVGMLSCRTDLLEEAARILEKEFGKINAKSDFWLFDFTDYYTRDMGAPLWRQFIAFQQLIDPCTIKEIKCFTNVVEQKISSYFAPPSRPVNLDPGYLCFSKIILATTKDHAHRIYLGNGIYGEITLRFYHKLFTPCDWTYPDYRLPQYIDFFQNLRETYRCDLKNAGE